jgi:hypothetical protein
VPAGEPVYITLYADIDLFGGQTFVATTHLPSLRTQEQEAYDVTTFAHGPVAFDHAPVEWQALEDARPLDDAPPGGAATAHYKRSYMCETVFIPPGNQLVVTRDVTSGGQRGHPAPLASRLHMIPTHFLLHLYRI